MAAREGAIVKGGRYLETLARIDTVAIDKTGTLTYGTPAVASIEPLPGVASREVVEAAAIAERRSEHPLARAILDYARSMRLVTDEPETFEAMPGRGVEARLGGRRIIAGSVALLSERGVSLDGLVNVDDAATTVVFVARDTRVLGAIRIADTLRSEAQTAVTTLRAMGIHTVLLTGDQHAVAMRIARELGVDQTFAGLLPEDKVKQVERLTREGRRVAMVGDGLNDAAALVAASAAGTGVGVAMGSGTDVARESADVVLIGNDLSKFVHTLRLARRMRGIIMQNFAGTIAVDSVGIVLAAFGFLNPLLAAFIHVSSELAFILNSTRLL